MRYLTTILDKLISTRKEAVAPTKGTTASFFSTKYDAVRRRISGLTVSESVAPCLSLPGKDNFFSNLVKWPLAFVVITEGNKGPSAEGGAAL